MDKQVQIGPNSVANMWVGSICHMAFPTNEGGTRLVQSRIVGKFNPFATIINSQGKFSRSWQAVESVMLGSKIF